MVDRMTVAQGWDLWRAVVGTIMNLRAERLYRV